MNTVKRHTCTAAFRRPLSVTLRTILARLGIRQAAAVRLPVLPVTPVTAEIVTGRPPVYCRRDLPANWSGAGS